MELRRPGRLRAEPPAGPRTACCARSTGSRRSSAATTRRASSADGWPGPRRRSGSRPSCSRSCRLATDGGRPAAGAFDPRVEALARLWSRCAKEGRTPTARGVAAARASMSRPAGGSTRPRGRPNGSPIARSASTRSPRGTSSSGPADAAMAEGGVRGVLLNVGGDMRVCGAWTARSGSPTRGPTRESSGRSPGSRSGTGRSPPAATRSAGSGSAAAGTRTSSIPVGPPVERVAAATVIADRSADADALATIFNVLAPEESVRLARTIPGVECLIVAADGGVTRSDGWGRCERPGPVPLAIDRARAEASDKEPGRRRPLGRRFELLVKLEINRPHRQAALPTALPRRLGRGQGRALGPHPRSGSRATSPAVAGPDLKRWYRGDQARRKVEETDLVATIARPTREPGKYEIIWDGKDDQGKPVGRGEYTLSIEAAREHGTYQIIRQRSRSKTRPSPRNSRGISRSKSASVEGRRKTSPPADGDRRPWRVVSEAPGRNPDPRSAEQTVSRPLGGLTRGERLLPLRVVDLHDLGPLPPVGVPVM